MPDPVAEPVRVSGEPALEPARFGTGEERHDADTHAERTVARPAAVVALAGLIVPGLGYALIGQTRRALVAGITILALFVGGILIGGIRVIDVPGYREATPITLPDGGWVVWSQPVRAVLQKPWYMGQIFVGPAALVASHFSISAADAGYPKPTARLGEIGTLYCAVAGMLNLLVVLDASSRAGRARGED